MKVNWKAELVNFDGKPMEISAEDQSNETATLGKVAIMALCWSGDTNEVGGAEKYKRFDMMMRIHKGEEDFSTEEVALIEKLIGKALVTSAAGAAIYLLKQYGEGAKKRAKPRS